MFCIYLRTNSDLCHLQHKLIGFYNRDEKCLQRGTNWVFKCSNLRFVLKGLMYTVIKMAKVICSTCSEAITCYILSFGWFRCVCISCADVSEHCICQIFTGRVNRKNNTTYGDGIECSETSAHKIQTPQNHPKERIQHSQHGESLKSRKHFLVMYFI